MKHLRFVFSFLALASLTTSSFADGDVIVPCNQPVKSKKRGICLNEFSDKDFMAVAPSVSWYYTWHFTDTNHAPKEANITFIPMAWGNREADLKGLADYLRSNKPPVVLAINEPNLKGQAFIDPKTTAEFYLKVKDIADKYKIPVVGPNMSLGSAENDSITALDPIENKQVTYTFQNPFLKAFLHFVGDKTEVPALGTHTYGDLGELKWLVDMMPKEFNRPVWVTEFANWHAKSPEQEMEYLIQGVDLMERLPMVHGYAWFKERVKDNQKISLLDKSGELTALGQAYVNMPVHDPAVYYRLPGKLQLESYTTMEKAEIAPTKDTDGFLEMKVSDANAWLDYQVYSEKAQNYTASLRVSTGEGTEIALKSGDKTLATFKGGVRGWQTITAPVTLPAGKSSLRLVSNGPARLNALEFAAK